MPIMAMAMMGKLLVSFEWREEVVAAAAARKYCGCGLVMGERGP